MVISVSDQSLLERPRFKGTLSGMRKFLATETNLKMMNKAFYFTSKALFALMLSRCLSFWLEFLVMEQNGLIRKIMFISNFIASQPGQQTIVVPILLNISRSKGNHRMKFNQLIGCNMRNIFLEESYTKYNEETSLRPVSENQI